ncbi:signal transduction histidine kinase [Methanoregula boonei 6A8]|jgi:PAS domain S-box-containing protein|uniref:histidine kinase n=1 Tax=Methanoregula boonei (strain DSM 21154 / JCM 14090 / 6A8) TaxID=456442 RepID=A7I8F3_METB6|nr:PAS domain S-box protein [Methanoregula boonei]ABS56014.1 signal transduction histidine kinase [Methanoregula boonei 6A8]
MSTLISHREVRNEQDVVSARFQARIIAEQLGFSKSDQTRISTAVSEISRNMFQYANGGEIEFCIDNGKVPTVFSITARDHGRGISRLEEILNGRFTPGQGKRLGIIVSKRLMDQFFIDTRNDGTTVFLGKNLPLTAPPVTPDLILWITDMLAKNLTLNGFDEIQIRNQDITDILEELHLRQEDLAQVNRELEETNRGVVALYVELDDKAAALKTLRDELEIRVQERTNDLSKANDNLVTTQKELHAQFEELADRDRELSVSEERFRISAQSISDVIWDRSIPDGRMEWYGRIDELLGYAPLEFPRTFDSWKKSIYPDDRDRVMALLDRHVKTRAPYATEYRVVQKDGKIRYWTDRGIAMLDSQGNAYRMVGSCTDITDRRLADEERARLAAIVEYSEDAIISKTLDGIVTSWNAGAERIYGYSVQEMVGKEISLLESPDHPNDTVLILERIRNGEPVIRYETRRRRKDGELIDITLTASQIRDAQNRLIGVSTIAHDITQRKRAEDAMHASEMRYRRLFEAAQDGILILDAESGQIVEVNPFLINMLGFSREQFLGKKIWEIGTFKDIVANKDNFGELQRKEYIRYEDMPLETSDGQRIAVEFVSNVYEVNNKKVIQCNIRDNTDRKLAEEAKIASEMRYRRLFEAAQDGILILDAESGQIVEVNPFLINMLGFSREQFLGKKIWEIGTFKDIVANKDNFGELQRKEYIRYEDMPLETADGRHIAVEFISNVYEVNNKKVIQCNIRDSTDRKLAEEAKIASEVRYRRLFETAQDGILILDAESGQIVEVNPFLINMLGFSREQFLGKKIWEIGTFKDIVANKDNFEELQRKEYISYEDMPLETADGQRIAVEFISNVYEVNNKKVIQCNIRDITKRKLAEEALRQKNEEIDGYFTNTLDLLCIADADGHFRRPNKEWETALGYSPAELEGKRLFDFVHPDDMEVFLGAMSELSAGKKVLQFTNRYRHRNQTYRWIEWRLFSAGNLIYASARDVTERKKMTDLVEASLAEKETLLREIHHRVKNNLQIISSLLNLQIRKIDDPKTIEVLKDCQSRVLSMALVHEHLYKGKDFSRIDLKNYIHSLGMQLSQSYGNANEIVRFDLNLPDIYVDINTAIPLGLIINELITNSLKYAFKGRKDGKLSITATENDRALTLIVADNGVGMPEGITLENQTSLGLRLVKTLTGQIHGTVVIDRTGGTKFVFVIPKPAEIQRTGPPVNTLTRQIHSTETIDHPDEAKFVLTVPKPAETTGRM